MSTYNGEPYLREQVDSIVRQTVPARLFVRDDGSIDGTRNLLETLSSYHDIMWSYGANLGSTASFFHLLRKYSDAAEYVAFADQDDVWLPAKLERAVIALLHTGQRRPALYCSSATITDKRLKPLGTTPIWPRRPAFGNALVENIASGCTIVLNRPAIELLTAGPVPRHTPCHDWWCYLVVSAFGTVVYDSNPSLLYRQHRNNVIGATPSPVKRLFNKVARQFKQDSLAIILAQAEEFALHYGWQLSPRKRASLNALLAGRHSLVARERLLFDRRIFRQRKSDDALLRLRFASGLWPAPTVINIDQRLNSDPLTLA
jgi:glycosyltransferase involved in cell wall biosynthesis